MNEDPDALIQEETQRERGSNQERRRSKACTSKVKYVRREYGDQAIAEIAAREGRIDYRLCTYRCNYCGYWHTGHASFTLASPDGSDTH